MLMHYFDISNEAIRILTLAGLPLIGTMILSAIVFGMIQNFTNIFDPVISYSGRLLAIIIWMYLVGGALYEILREFLQRSLSP